MSDDNENNLDWTHLPQDVEVHSLSECLHDAELCSIRSDLFQRNVVLIFDVLYLREFNGLPLDTRFIFQFEGVKSARAIGFAKWPGAFSVPVGISREAEAQLIREFQAKWREESRSWSAVETSIMADSPMEVSDARIARREGEHLAFKLTGHDSNDQYLELFITAEKLDVLRSDGLPLGLPQFQKFGELYWENFASNRLMRRKVSE